MSFVVLSLQDRCDSQLISSPRHAACTLFFMSSSSQASSPREPVESPLSRVSKLTAPTFPLLPAWSRTSLTSLAQHSAVPTSHWRWLQSNFAKLPSDARALWIPNSGKLFSTARTSGCRRWKMFLAFRYREPSRMLSPLQPGWSMVWVWVEIPKQRFSGSV